MDLSKLLHGFVNGFFKFDVWISQSSYMDLSKLIHEFLYAVTWIFLLNYILNILWDAL